MASVAGIVVALPAVVWVVTLGSWDLFRPGFFGDFYDAQARALFHGHWYVPAGVVQIEGFLVKGHTYMYFGPFPALLRMPVLLVTSRLDGRLTELSIVLAVVVALVCTSRLAWKVRRAVSTAPVSMREAVLVAFSVAVVGTGSVFLFLASQAVVYNEDEAWGAALAIAAFDALVGFLLRPSTRRLVVTAVLVTLDLLTRGSVGLGPLSAMAAVAVLHGVLWVRRRRAAGDAPAGPGADGRLAWIGIPDAATSPTFGVALAVSVVVALGAYAAVNDMKFGSLFTVPFTAQVFARQDPTLRRALAANGGSLLGLKFVPTALVQYLRPDALRFTRVYPFAAFPPLATVIGHVRYATRTWASSVTSTMPAIVAAAAVGVWTVFGRRRGGQHGSGGGVAALAVLRIPLAGAAVGTVSSVAYAYIVERYLADWMPLLVLAGLAGLFVVVERTRTTTRARRRTVAAVGVALSLFGVAANLALSIANEGELTPTTPIASRVQFIDLQQRVDRDLWGDPPPGVTVRRRLPAVEPAGNLVVVGDCAALYQSDGSGWGAVEQSARGGHFRLRVRFTSVGGPSSEYWPLVVTGEPGAGDYVALRASGPDEVRAAYLYQQAGSTWFEGPPVAVEPGRPYVVDIVLDAVSGSETVTIDGTTALTVLWFARTPVHPTLGTDTIGGPTATSFPGTVSGLPTPTPVCDGVRHHLAAGG
jgi:hypothetical protein